MKKFKSLFLLILMLGTFFLNSGIRLTFGADIYSDVFDDLRECENFEMADYPSLTYEECEAANQPLLQVIQIAESGADELYLYVYEPTASTLDLEARKISMSVEFSKNGADLNPYIYELKLLSSYKTLNKYLVRDFEVNDETYRYYNIVTIYRDYIKEIDEIASGTEDIGENKIGISVGQQWCTYYLNNELVYEMNTFETMNIEIKHTDYFEFSSGIKIGQLVGAFDFGLSWFVCFDVEEYIVKRIFDADVNYKIRDKSYSEGLGLDGTPTYGEWSKDLKVTLYEKDIGTYDGGGLFSKEYKWNRISSSSDFIKNAEEQDINITDECLNGIKNSQWVFSFLETEEKYYSGNGSYTVFTYDVADIGIMRLHFMDINNKIYDLGVVSDLVDPDDTPGGNGSGIDIEEWFEKILMLIGVLILLTILGFCTPIVITILSAIIICFKWILKGVLLIISLPFKIIGVLFNKRE